MRKIRPKHERMSFNHCTILYNKLNACYYACLHSKKDRLDEAELIRFDMSALVMSAVTHSALDTLSLLYSPYNADFPKLIRLYTDLYDYYSGQR